MEEYFGWISIKEKIPPIGMSVLIAYVDEDGYECLVSNRYESKLGGNISLGEKWLLPQYYKQENVKAWRAIPPFDFS